MSEVLFQSSRRFQLWRYNVSHRQLLLRSTKGIDAATRIDILFKDVAALKLWTESAGLLVRKATPTEANSIDPDLNGIALDGKTLFIAEAPNCSGYVVAGMMEHIEDAGEYDEPSQLFSNL